MLSRSLTTIAIAAALVLPSCKKSPPTDAPIDLAPASADASPLVLGVLPAVTVERTREAYAPFVEALSKVMGQQAELFVAKDYEALRDAMITGDVQLAQVSAYLYVSTAVVRQEAGRPFHVLAQERRVEERPYVGVFVVKKDNPATGLADLRGKSIAYVDRSSSSGFYYPRIRMRAMKLDPDDFFSQEHFAGSHTAAIEMVKTGKADVGAVSEMSSTLTGLRVLDRTDPIPEDALVSLTGLDEDEREKLEVFLYTAHTKPELANFFIVRGLERYVPAQIDVYVPQRREIERTGGPAKTAEK